MNERRGVVSLGVWVVGLVALALAVSFPAAAQVQYGSLTGVVTDPTGAVVPRAEVKITHVGTGLSQTVTTGPDGRYRADQLSLGRYEIAVTAEGFKTAVQSAVAVSAGTITRVDVQVEIGARAEVVTVEAAPPLVNTEDSRLSVTVGGRQVEDLPLNGRNVYDLIQMAPGAVNVTGVSFENGEETVVNGLRPNFNGFLLNGVSNKGLSGGSNTLPNPDIVAEFQQLTLNMSAQYGNSAASLINVVTKSGDNDFHGSVFYFFRNDKLDANNFFRNKGADPTNPDDPLNEPSKVRFNQFGATARGPILKDRLFFSASWQSQRFTSESDAIPIVVESAAWRQAIISAFPNSVAAFIYSNFPPSVPGTPLLSLRDYVTGGSGGFGATSFADYLCQEFARPDTATRFATLFGVTAQDQADLAALGCTVLPLQAGLISRDIGFFNSSVAAFGVQEAGNLIEGDDWSTRVDWVRGTSDRVFGEFYWQDQTDTFGPANNSSGPRGFKNPVDAFFPNFQFSWVHTFNPTVVNDLRVGFTRSREDLDVAIGGVPSLVFDDGSAGFGSYNGYPQFFKENIYTYSDLMSVTKGTHNFKMGLEFRRNIENSVFNVGRPSYGFFDQLFFALDAPYLDVAGVDPGLFTGALPRLDENNRAWRNLEVGAFFQDDWKIHRNLTLNLGLRYDLYTRHTEKFGRITTWIPGIGGTRAEGILNANIPGGQPGCDTPDQLRGRVLAGVCGPGGFAVVDALGGSDHNNFGPRVGVAWDIFGNRKTAFRAGFGISFEGTLYNPLSNSRWNPPFYSFNIGLGDLIGGQPIIYGPQDGSAPRFDGPNPNPGAGTGVLGEGNIQGWSPLHPNIAFLTGIVLPEGIRDPWVSSFHMGIQHELFPQTVLEITYVGTRGNKLFRAEQINRRRGIRLPAGTVLESQGETLVGLGRRFLNPNYGNLRNWLNVTSSTYDGLQVGLRKAMSHGFMLNGQYAWSHSLDNGSGWHSGAVTANGGAAGDGYSLDADNRQLDKGNSTFDIRHRFVLNGLWDMPWHKDQQGVMGHILGGWQLNGIWAMQSGAHWTAYDARFPGGDYNFDGTANDRPDAPNGNNISGSTDQYANGYFNVPGGSFGCALTGCTNPFFAVPCLACNGSLGRNTFEGPGQFNVDASLFKNFRVTETIRLQFRFEAFNVLNHTSFILPSSSTGANFANRVSSPIFGSSAGTLDSRAIQLGLKLLW